MGDHWTRPENEQTVATYLEMLELELGRVAFTKSLFEAQLARSLTGRSPGAVSRKLMNVSAVLVDLGYVHVVGYKPLSHYQALLADVVVAHLEARPGLADLVATAVNAAVVAPQVDDVLDTLVPAPPAVGRAYGAVASRLPRDQRLDGVARDFLAVEAANAELGAHGELFVIGFEQARLRQADRPDLAERIDHVARTIGPRAGFDVRSFEVDGSDRLIEVKTTAYGATVPFYVTANELAVSRARAGEYHLYRPHHFRLSPRLFILKGGLDRICVLDPLTYRARVA
jgi:hypothetical protein